MNIATTQAQKKLVLALEHTKGLNGVPIFPPRPDGVDPSWEENRQNELVRESLQIVLRSLDHAKGEMEAELHKLEYGYDISHADPVESGILT